MTPRHEKSAGEYCAEEIPKAAITTCSRECSRECSRGCSKAFIIMIAPHLINNILNFGMNFSSFKEFFIGVIKKYQKDISPKLNTQCLFEPSCSVYAIGAITKYGAIRGLIKISERIIKCSPLTKRPLSGQIVEYP